MDPICRVIKFHGPSGPREAVELKGTLSGRTWAYTEDLTALSAKISVVIDNGAIFINATVRKAFHKAEADN